MLSGQQDSNLRPPGPKPGTLTGLRYAPIVMAESVGFEPTQLLLVDGLANRSFNHSGNSPARAIAKRGANIKEQFSVVQVYQVKIVKV